MSLPFTFSWVFASSKGYGAVSPEIEVEEKANIQSKSTNLTPIYILLTLLMLMNLITLWFIIQDKVFLFRFRKSITDALPLVERNPEESEVQQEEELQRDIFELESEHEPEPEPEQPRNKFQNDTFSDSEEFERKMIKNQD
jgi:hypothetical protein